MNNINRQPPRTKSSSYQKPNQENKNNTYNDPVSKYRKIKDNDKNFEFGPANNSKLN